jgi:hypothetical protein
LTGSFFNGERRITSTASRVEGNHIVFTFAQYAAALEATLQADGLSGEYRRDARLKYPFRAVPAATKDIRDEGGPPIAGTWIVQAKSSRRTAWHHRPPRPRRDDCDDPRGSPATPAQTARQDSRYVLIISRAPVPCSSKSSRSRTAR